MNYFSVCIIVVLFGLLFIGSSCTQQLSTGKVTYKPDTEPPVFISFPKNIVDTCGNISEFGTPVAKDNSGKTHLIFVDQNKGSCEEGLMIIRTWSARDSSGNSVKRNQIIKLAANQSVEPPILDDKLHVFYQEGSTEVKLRFLLQSSKKIKASISDMDGKQHFKIEKELPAGQQSILVDVTSFPTGTYFVMLNYDNKWLSRQFIK